MPDRVGLRQGHPQLGMLHPWHFFAGPDANAELDSIPAERLGFVRFGDAIPATSEEVAYHYRHCRVLPGDGIHDLRGSSQQVLRRCPDVGVSVEVVSSWWRSRPVEGFATETFRSNHPFWPTDTQ
jgi:hypothetical protein